MAAGSGLPVILSPNLVSIYGHVGWRGVRVLGNIPHQYGIVEGMYFGAEEDLTGQSVLFRLDKATMVEYNDAPYFLLQQQDIILTEIAPS